jgi:protein-L-isoaspartate(D-aspartate) O-methyltransferase
MKTKSDMTIGRRAVPRVCLSAMMVAMWIECPSRADEWADERNRMVDEEIVAGGVKDPRVIQSMRNTPRHEFMPAATRKYAYFDMAVAIGHGQTISPPFVVAYMTEQLKPEPTDKVLEIGTGSGYQAAVLGPLVKEVYTIEIVEPLGQRAARTLKRLNYANVHSKVGDGYQGWPEHAPFDKVVVTCSPEQVPSALVDQLREGGRMVVPVGERYQQTLYLFEKREGKLDRIALLPTLFVPMTGKAEEDRVVKPDAAKPSIFNGGFEQTVSLPATANGSQAQNASRSEPAGWHYQRQLKLEQSDDAPEGKHFITFSNTVPGRGAHALQGLPVDGRQVQKLDVSLWVKADNVRPGANDSQKPILGITFYDANRAETGHIWIGPWSESFGWRAVHESVRVPGRAREAVVRIGMNGATGAISFDDVRIHPGS